MTYNHSHFIENALDGFCVQETSFPFVCVIVDDASTDGEQLIIEKYLQANFSFIESHAQIESENDNYRFVFAHHRWNPNCFFAVFFLKYNHYSIRKSKAEYYACFDKPVDYIAICEGDDYWTASYKLQYQVSYLDSHLDCTMTCCRTSLYSQQDKIAVGENYCYLRSRRLSVRDTIYRTGLFVSTCSIVYRKEVDENKPSYWVNCLVGDYPLQIACVLKGYAWYFNDLMSVYRIDNPNSWMGKQNWSDAGRDFKRKSVIESQINMFRGFSSDYSRFKRLFENKIADQINRNIPGRDSGIESVRNYLSFFSKEISNYTIRWKIDLFIRKSRIPYLRGLYNKIFMRRFSHKCLYY